MVSFSGLHPLEDARQDGGVPEGAEPGEAGGQVEPAERAKVRARRHAQLPVTEEKEGRAVIQWHYRVRPQLGDLAFVYLILKYCSTCPILHCQVELWYTAARRLEYFGFERF